MNSEESENLEVKILVVVAKTQVDVPVYVVESFFTSLSMQKGS